MLFQVQQEAVAPAEVSDIEQIIAGIEHIHPKRNSYYIVTKPGEDYLQFAGSRDRLVAEVRNHSGRKFRHWVIGRDVEPGFPDRVECNVGPIVVNQNQLLNVEDAKKLIAAFCAGRPWPQGYRLADVTERFL